MCLAGRTTAKRLGPRRRHGTATYTPCCLSWRCMGAIVVRRSWSTWPIGMCRFIIYAVSCVSLCARPKLRKLLSFFSTTAGIIKEYLVPSLLPKKVDFCIVLDPRSSPDEKDKAMADRIDQRRRTCPLTSINHTDLDSLISRPIVVSIETKRDGGSLEQAQPQAGTWQSAHWNVLARLVAGDGPDGTRELSSGSDGPDPLDALPFLPAIIIQGHEWSLAATTRVGTKKVSYRLGSRSES